MMLSCKKYPIKLLITNYKRQVNLNFPKEFPWPFTKKSRIGMRDQKQKKVDEDDDKISQEKEKQA